MYELLLSSDLAHTPIQFTISGAWIALIGICTGIIAISGAAKNIGTLIGKFKKPEKTQDDRIASLEEGVEKLKIEVEELGEKHDRNLEVVQECHKRELEHTEKKYEEILEHQKEEYKEIMRSYRATKERHDKEITDIGEGMLVNLKATTAILQTLLNGDDDREQIKDCLDEVNSYIYEKSKLHHE